MDASKLATTLHLPYPLPPPPLPNRYCPHLPPRRYEIKEYQKRCVVGGVVIAVTEFTRIIVIMCAYNGHMTTLKEDMHVRTFSGGQGPLHLRVYS